MLGSGAVGQVLAKGFVKHGYNVIIGSRSPEKLAEFAAAAGVRSGTFDEAAQADVIVLAVAGGVAIEAVDLAGHTNLAGKIVLDATNPIANTPPKGGTV